MRRAKNEWILFKENKYLPVLRGTRKHEGNKSIEKCKKKFFFSSNKMVITANGARIVSMRNDDKVKISTNLLQEEPKAALP